MDDDEPIAEPEWQPLRRALHDALWNCQIILPKAAEVALVAEVVDQLTAENIELIERTDP